MDTISSTIRTEQCDWLMATVVFRESQWNCDTTLLENIFLSFSEIVTICTLAEEDLETLDVIFMSLDKLKESNFYNVNPSGLAYFNKFKKYFEWLRRKRDNKDTDNQTYWSLALLHICEKYFSPKKSDYQKLAFKCINDVRENLNFTEKTNSSSWALGWSFFMQTRFIETEHVISTGASMKLLLKAQELLLPILRNKLSLDPVYQGLFIKKRNSLVARVKALLDDVDGCLYYVLKSKIAGELSNEEARSHPDFVNFTKNDEFNIILSENLESAKEHLDFIRDRRAATANKGINTFEPEKNQVPLDTTLTQSTILKNALTRSSLDFLAHNNLGHSVFLRSFFKTVVSPTRREAEKRLNERLALYNLKAKDIAGDGNCQMYSLSDQLCHKQKYAKFIRRRLVHWLRCNKDLPLPNGATLEQFVVGQTWDEYCEDMAKDGTWGDHLTLTAAAEVFQLRIVIISSIPDSNFIIEVIPANASPNNTIMLSHFAEFHYGSVHPV